MVDDRITSPAAQAGVLRDEATGYLFIATHRRQASAASVADPATWARLLTYRYDQAAMTSTLESGFPVTINTDITETLVLDKENFYMALRPDSAGAATAGSGQPFYITLTSD